jgi:acetyl-CoA carboxylase carboxyl transferase subunit alpha
MMNLLEVKAPVITIVTGEGCSGGALGLSVADTLAMFSGATYSVISPESYSTIIFDKPKVQPELLRNMRFTAKDLYSDGLIDNVLKEGTLEYNVSQIKNYFAESLAILNKLEIKQLLARRYNRIRGWDKK